MKTSSYQDLHVWQKSIDLVERVYALTSDFPKTEQFGLTSQMQRAAVSIPSNIAEGSLRRHTNEFCHFLSIALGSAAELETQLMICARVINTGQLNIQELLELLSDIKKMLYALINKLENSTIST